MGVFGNIMEWALKGGFEGKGAQLAVVCRCSAFRSESFFAASPTTLWVKGNLMPANNNATSPSPLLRQAHKINSGNSDRAAARSKIKV